MISRSGGKFLYERPDQNSFILEQRQRQLVVVARLEATATNRSRGADDHRERSLPAGGDARGQGRTAGSASDSRLGFALENPNSESVQQRGVLSGDANGHRKSESRRVKQHGRWRVI